jgi:hypothetical protein
MQPAKNPAVHAIFALSKRFVGELRVCLAPCFPPEVEFSGSQYTSTHRFSTRRGKSTWKLNPHPAKSGEAQQRGGIPPISVSISPHFSADYGMQEPAKSPLLQDL